MILEDPFRARPSAVRRVVVAESPSRIVSRIRGPHSARRYIDLHPSERVREGVNVREGESAGEGERDLVLIVMGPKTNITGSTGLTGWDNRSNRSGPVDRKIFPLKVYRLSLKLMAMIKFNQKRLTSGCYNPPP